MISGFRAATAVLLISVCLLLVVGCGETFRPTITPIPQPAGDAAPQGQAIVVSTNPAGDGSNTHINVSGDSNVGVVPVGSNPVFMGKNTGRVFVINRSADTTVTPDTVTSYIALLPQVSTVTTITLPTPSSSTPAQTPVAGGSSNTGTLYIANFDSNNVTFIPSSSNVAAGVIPLAPATHPVMIAGGAANTNKMYVVDQGDGTNPGSVSVISTQDNTVQSTITVGVAPVWAVMSSDGLDVFVVNQGDNSVYVIDTTGDAVIAKITVGLSPNFAFYESKLKRVYVSNTAESSISVIKADVINLGASPPQLPTLLKTITLSGAPVSVTALSDGTRAYAALGGCPAGTNHLNLLANLSSCSGNQVSVIDVLGLRESKVLALGSGTVSIDAADDASRVYVVNAHDGTISIIKTSADSELTDSSGHPLRMSAPQQNLACSSPPSCAATGTQIPFMVRAFP